MGGRRARLGARAARVAWVVSCVVAACGYDDLKQLPVPDAPDGPSDTAPAGPPPSCAGLAETCGPSLDDDCCRSAEVPGGAFLRSFDAAVDAHNDDRFPATVSTFALDRYEVTVGRFRAFVEAGQGTRQPGHTPAAGAGAHPHLAGSGWDSAWNVKLPADRETLTARLQCNSTLHTWTDTAGDHENKPINCVSWYEAMAFCIWDGGYLPTEAEWNYAASGGAEQRAYPWSSPASSTDITCAHANYACATSQLMTPAVTPVGGTSPEGDGRWHHADLAGNVWEWVLDWFAPGYSQDCADCAQLTPAAQRVRRGGGLVEGAAALRTAQRHQVAPLERYGGMGFRCARPAR